MSCDNIRGGFSFCGIDIADLGLSYVPEKEDTYVYRPAETNTHEEVFDGHHGGYFYGASKQPKEFLLRCYFEDEAIDKGVMERIYSLFRVGRSGKLIFDRKPWCYYYATVTSSPAPELSNLYNGLISITMKAYYPYSRSDSMYSLPTDQRHELAIASTALFDKDNMAPPTSFTNLRARTSLLLHNPGTERAAVSILIAGNSGLGVTVFNKTTNQKCKFVAMDKAHTSSVNKAVYIDGINGNTSLVSTNNTASPTSAFLYHDSGFIELEPAYPAVRNVYIQRIEDNNVYLYNTLYTDVTGHYIYINNVWHKILEQIDDQTLRLENIIEFTPEKTMITRMNEIEIIPDDEMDITRLSFSYKPTFA